MIDVKKENVNEVIQEIHEVVQRRKVKKEQLIKEEIVAESRLFALLCKNAGMEPTKCAVTLNDKYGYDFTGDQIIQMFRRRRMANPVERNMGRGSNGQIHFFAASFRSFLPLRKVSTRGSLPGQVNAQLPHSMQSIKCSRSSSWSFSALT